MTIAVHIALQHPHQQPGTDFIYNCFSLMAATNPDHHFIFVFDKPFNIVNIKSANITPVLAGPVIKNRLLQHYFYNYKLPRLLNKYQADVFVSEDVCSLRSTIPQYLIINDLSFLQKHNLYNGSDLRYLKRYSRQFVKKADKIAVMNDHLKEILQVAYSLPAQKISVINNAVVDKTDVFNEERINNVKEKLTDGKSYFLFFASSITISNVITMLKAFSIFKKWQKSNMQLVILFSASEKDYVIKDLNNYKHREDVRLLHATSEQKQNETISAAYAAINLASMEISETEGLKTIASNIPLITTDNIFFRSTYADAAAYCQPTDKDVAEKMMLLYKDENYRSSLINNGQLLSEKYSLPNATNRLWQTIQWDTVA